MFGKNIVIILLFTSFSKVNSAEAETVNLTIADGVIRGLVNTTVEKNVTYYNFRGIPFAKPPLGDLRFASPVKNSPWNGTYDATYDRTQCIQYSSSDIFGTTLLGDEDCLYINVYTPDLNATDLPVLVWIYGGAFLSGNSSYVSFGPDYFLEQDLVFVSFNYRLGIFGFLSTEDEACPGNWGLKDQVLALKWVQENIAYFGGNPDNVTIFGESAGAVSVHLMMQTNQTKGLFHRAIMNSGTSLNLWSLNTRAAKSSALIGINLGIITTSNKYLVKQLRTVKAKTLQKVGWRIVLTLFLSDALRGLPWGPVMEPDVDGAVLINPSDYALSQGNFHQVPVLMGMNSNEAAVYTDVPFLLRFYLLYYDINESDLTPYSMTRNGLKRFLAGQSIDNEYFENSLIALSNDSLVYFISADQFNRPIRRAATLMSSYTNVYFYVFGYQGIKSGVTEREFEGVGHGEDLDYFFRSNNNSTETDDKVSKLMVKLWSNFAKYANPTPYKEAAFNNTIWYPVNVTNSSNFNYISLNESVATAINPKQTDWLYYQNLWAKYGDENETTTY